MENLGSVVSACSVWPSLARREEKARAVCKWCKQHLHTLTGHLGQWTPVPKGPGGERRWIWNLCVGRAAGAWERGCTVESRKTDTRRSSADNRGREVQVLLFTCERWPQTPPWLSVTFVYVLLGVADSSCGDFYVARNIALRFWTRLHRHFHETSDCVALIIILTQTLWPLTVLIQFLLFEWLWLYR